MTRTISWQPANANKPFVVYDPPLGGELHVFPDGCAVMDGWASLGFLNGVIDRAGSVSGTLTIEGYDRGNGGHQINGLPWMTGRRFSVRERKLRVPRGAGERQRAWMLRNAPEGRGLVPTIRLNPTSINDNLDLGGGASMAVQDVPAMNYALWRGGLPPGFDAECDRILDDWLTRGIWSYWRSGKFVTAMECQQHGWCMHHGYKNPNGGYGAGLWGSVLPPGISIADSKTGRPNVDVSHLTPSICASSAMFTHDNLMAQAAVQQFESAYSLHQRSYGGSSQGRHNAVQERSRGWVGTGIAWLERCLAPYRPDLSGRLRVYLLEWLDEHEHARPRIRTPSGEWVEWAPTVSATSSTPSWSAWVRDYYKDDPVSADHAEHNAYKTFMTAGALGGAMELRSAFEDLDLETTQRVNKAVRLQLMVLAMHAGNYGIGIDPYGNTIGPWPDGLMPQFIRPGLVVSPGQVVPFVIPQPPGNQATFARFGASRLAQAVLEGHDTLGHARRTLERLCPYYDATGSWDIPSTGWAKDERRGEWMLPLYAGGFTTYGLPPTSA